MPISTVQILKYVQQCYVKWFWTISSLGAPEFLTPDLQIRTNDENSIQFPWKCSNKALNDDFACPNEIKTRLNCRLLVKWLRKWSKFAWTSSDVFGSLRKIVGNPRKSLGQFRKSRRSDKAKISQISISFDWKKVGGYTTGSHGQPWGTPDFKWQGGWSKDFFGFELSISGLFRVGKFWQFFFG